MVSIPLKQYGTFLTKKNLKNTDSPYVNGIHLDHLKRHSTTISEVICQKLRCDLAASVGFHPPYGSWFPCKILSRFKPMFSTWNCPIPDWVLIRLYRTIQAVTIRKTTLILYQNLTLEYQCHARLTCSLYPPYLLGAFHGSHCSRSNCFSLF